MEGTPRSDRGSDQSLREDEQRAWFDKGYWAAYDILKPAIKQASYHMKELEELRRSRREVSHSQEQGKAGKGPDLIHHKGTWGYTWHNADHRCISCPSI